MARGHGARPEATKQRALDHLLQGKSIRAVAELVEVSEATIDKWLRDPGFRSELLERSRAISDASMSALISANTKATAKLVELISSEDPTIAIRACLAVLNTSQKWLSSDLQERVQKLESILNELIKQA